MLHGIDAWQSSPYFQSEADKRSRMYTVLLAAIVDRGKVCRASSPRTTPNMPTMPSSPYLIVTSLPFSKSSGLLDSYFLFCLFFLLVLLFGATRDKGMIAPPPLLCVLPEGLRLFFVFVVRVCSWAGSKATKVRSTTPTEGPILSSTLITVL